MSTRTAVVILLSVLLVCATVLLAVSWSSDDPATSDPDYFCPPRLDC